MIIFKNFLSSILNKVLNLYKTRILNMCLKAINKEARQNNIFEIVNSFKKYKIIEPI